MNNKSAIPSITHKVECGTERGTVFFVDAHLLLTAYHVVGSSLNGNPIYVEIERVAHYSLNTFSEIQFYKLSLYISYLQIFSFGLHTHKISRV